MKPNDFTDVLSAIVKFGAIYFQDLKTFTCLNDNVINGVTLKLRDNGLISIIPNAHTPIYMPTVDGFQWVKLYSEMKEPEPVQLSEEAKETIEKYGK